MWPNPQESVDLVTFTEDILNKKLYFLCRVFFKPFNPLSTFSNVSLSILLTSDYKLAKPAFWANFIVSRPVAFFESDFLA